MRIIARHNTNGAVGGSGYFNLDGKEGGLLNGLGVSTGTISEKAD